MSGTDSTPTGSPPPPPASSERKIMEPLDDDDEDEEEDDEEEEKSRTLTRSLFSTGRRRSWYECFRYLPKDQNLHKRRLRAIFQEPPPSPPAIIPAIIPTIIPTIVSPPYLFQSPITTIHSMDDLNRFRRSDTARNLIGFVAALSHSIRGHKLSDHCHQSQTLTTILSILDTLLRWVDEIPPIKMGICRGNLSFRSWKTRLSENAESLMLQLLPNDDEFRSATVEIVPYFTASFGDSNFIVYGTFHEANFIAWLYCLARLGLIKKEDYQALVSKVFVKYFELTRKLLLTYSLRPLGGHPDVWGLDDFHLLPFLFGSSQLINHKHLKPKSIHNQEILDYCSKEYLYLSYVAFVKKVKVYWGPFEKHSPMLDGISRVPSWEKVHTGLLNFYRVVGLWKLANMEHFLFGWLINWA